MTQHNKIGALADHALQEFPTRVEQALLEHVRELVAEPNPKNLADVRWLLEAVIRKHEIGWNIDPRLDELLERKRATGSLANKAAQQG